MDRFAKNDIISLFETTPKYDLAESSTKLLCVSDILSDSVLKLRDVILGYGTAGGDVRLRQMIAQQVDALPDDVVVTVGGAHALFLIAFIVCRPGEEVITTTPIFPLTRTALDAVGATVRALRLSFETGYRIDPSGICALLSPKTKLVSIASPQNPSGVTIPKSTLETILAAMRDVCPEAYLLVDETYRDAVYEDEMPAETAIALSPKVIIVSSISKYYGAPGLRLGWAVTRDAPLAEQLRLGKFNTVISGSLVDEALGLMVLEQRERIGNEQRRHMTSGFKRLKDWVSENSRFLEWVQPDAGAVCCVRLRSSLFTEVDALQLYRDWLNIGVRVANGTWFDEEARVFRLGFGLLEIADLEIALDLLTAILKSRSRR